MTKTGSDMDFFEALRQGAHNKFKGIFDDRASPPYSDGYMFGVSGTIEALKEMMVGEPIRIGPRHNPLWSKAVIEYDRLRWAENVASRWIKESRMAAIQMLALIIRLLRRGTHGEEVMICILRRPDDKEE